MIITLAFPCTYLIPRPAACRAHRGCLACRGCQVCPGACRACRSQLVDAQPITGTAKLLRVAATGHAALAARRHLRARAKLVATVALGTILGAEVREALTSRGAEFKRHGAVHVRLARERADARALRLASVPGVVADDEGLRGARGRVGVVDVEPVAGAAVLGRVSDAGCVAVGQVRRVRRGGEDVAAVAFVAVLRAEEVVVLAELGAGLERDVSGRGFRVEGAHAITLGPAALEGVGGHGGLVCRSHRGRGHRRCRGGRDDESIHLQPVAAAAVFRLVTATDYAAVCVVGHVAPGVDGLAAVAFTTKFRCEISKAVAVRCA